MAGASPCNPVAGRIGAEIAGVDISRPLDAAAVVVIQQALDTWKVVFFRDQRLDHAAQIAFGRQFGELTYAHPHDDTPPEGYPEIYTVDSRRFDQRFGFDAGGREAATQVLLHQWLAHRRDPGRQPAGRLHPARGRRPQLRRRHHLHQPGRRLRGPVRAGPRFVDTLRAEHRYGANWSGLPRPGRTGYERADRAELARRRTTPWCGCTRAPASGRCSSTRSSPTTSWTSSPIESRRILEHLFDELTRPEYTVRFRWEPGSVAFWDNRATAHLGPQDLGHLDVERVLHRVTLIGEVPVGPDGRESELVEGCRSCRRRCSPRSATEWRMTVVEVVRAARFAGPVAGRMTRRPARRGRPTALTRPDSAAARRRCAGAQSPGWPGGLRGPSRRCWVCGSWSARPGCSPGRGGLAPGQVIRRRPASCGTRACCSPTCSSRCSGWPKGWPSGSPPAWPWPWWPGCSGSARTWSTRSCRRPGPCRSWAGAAGHHLVRGRRDAQGLPDRPGLHVPRVPQHLRRRSAAST